MEKYDIVIKCKSFNFFFLKSSSKINSRGREVCGNGGEEGYLGMMREESILDKFLVLLSFL